jgi:hypothetical protein
VPGGSTLTQLFATSASSAGDVAAASTLASAFPPDSATAGAAASRVAERELSLDHLFRETPTGKTGAVSLDDFYSDQGAGSDRPPAPTEAESTDERAADIRQFTTWLEGLKKK